MKKLWIAALLACVGVSTQAATVLHFTAAGNGAEYTVKANDFSLVKKVSASIQIEYWTSDDSWGCFPTQTCTFGSNQIVFGRPIFGPYAWLNFTETSWDPAINEANFIGGSLNFNEGYSNLDGIGAVFSYVTGDFNYLSVERLDSLPPNPYVQAPVPYAFFNLYIGLGPPIPEPSTWALMIGGFALAGASLRRPKVRPAL